MNAAGFSDAAKKIIATVAPLLGTALGGPLGGTAGYLLAKALGGGDVKTADAAILSADPQTLLSLKKVESDFKSHMAELGVEEDKLAYADTASARQREVELKDHTPAILAYLVTVGFFGSLGYLIVYGAPKTNGGGGEAFLLMLGSLGTAWVTIIAYYFGSSAGAVRKDKALADIAKS